MKLSEFHEEATFDLVLKLGKQQADRYEIDELLVKGNGKVGHLTNDAMMFVTRGVSYHTCPGKTERCGKACYMNYMYLLSLHRGADVGAGYSYLALKDPFRLLRYLNRDLNRYKASPLKKFVRVHDGGDFVSADHVEVYIALALSHPEVFFWGFSHSYVIPEIAKALVRLNKLPNVAIRESTDPDRPVGTGLAPTAHFDVREKAIAHMQGLKAQGTPAILCPAEMRRKDGRGKYVRVKTCLECRACWEQPQRPVMFFQHGTSAQGSKKARV